MTDFVAIFEWQILKQTPHCAQPITTTCLCSGTQMKGHIEYDMSHTVLKWWSRFFNYNEAVVHTTWIYSVMIFAMHCKLVNAIWIIRGSKNMSMSLH